MALAIAAPLPLLGQAPVPFAGCRSDGQGGPEDAPSGNTRTLDLSREAAGQLAYYGAAQGPGVLGPRGWYCFGTYGSAGDTLYVSPQPIDTSHLFTKWAGFDGPAIEVDYRYGGTSGRFEVAEIIARVFPAFKEFVTNLKKFEPQRSFQFGPYPADALTYKSKTEVEYITPARADGLGTYGSLKKNGNEIRGVAVLLGTYPDLLHVAVRLPADLSALAPAIVTQVERDAAANPGGF